MNEKEIYHFKVPEAEATFDGNSLTVRLSYPAQIEEIHGRLPEQLDSGINVYEQLLQKGHARCADAAHPLKPAAAGSLYVLQDDIVVCHRRDAGAPTHKLYHSAYSGYTSSREFTRSHKGLLHTALRESAEECLLVTRDKEPWLIVPRDTQEYTLQSARRLGIDIPPRLVDVEMLPCKDRLEVYEGGKLLFNASVCLALLYESSTSLSALWLRKFSVSSEEVLPVDAEGMMKEGRFKHFNRESYFVSLDEIALQPFGTPLQSPRVFQTRIEDGKPIIYTPQSLPPYYGPENVMVKHPHLWAPDDLMVACFAGLDIVNYRGKNRLDLELWKMQMKRTGRPLISEEFLVVDNL